jgi:thioredoxin-like negative regulator of GroEL
MTSQTIKPGELPSGINLVKFTMPGCAPCKALQSQLEITDLGNVNIISINPQDDLDWTMNYNIRSVPTTIGFVDNNEAFRVVGNKVDQIEKSLKDLKN